MNDFNPIEQDIADRLRQQARSVDISDTPLTTVVSRGRQRAERRRVVVGLAAVVALSATAIGTIQLLSKPVSHRVAPATDSIAGDDATPSVTIAGDVPSDALTSITRVDSNLVWNVVEPGSTEALGSIIWDNRALSSQKPPYLAWSTAPGVFVGPVGGQDFIPTLYRSDDGIHWTAAGGESFTQPEISMRGVGSRNSRMFAFGTAAATAPINSGGGGDVVVDVSDDQGASWRDITLPIDLRGLASAKGVAGVGFMGDMVATDGGIVALGVPNVAIDQAVYPGGQSNVSYAPRRDGAVKVSYPTCPLGETATTISFSGGYSPSADTAPVETIPAIAGTTTSVVVPDTSPADSCATDTVPQQSDLIPWSDLGVDGDAVATMFAPRVFVSNDGENFVEGTFPTLPDGYQLNGIDLVATGTGFAATAMMYDMAGGAGLTKLYTSADGMTWTESDMPAGQYDSINVLDDGTIVAFGIGLPTGQPFTAVSNDGVEWSKLSLANLLDAADGKSAQLTISMSAAGPGGITAVGTVSVDAALEAGGFSIEKDGVRLTMTESRIQAMVATDVATGDELGRFDYNTPSERSGNLRYDDQGHFRVVNDDGSTRVEFTDTDMQDMNEQQMTATGTVKAVLLHSTDGINWSRDDVKPLTGFDTFGSTRVQVTDSNVLASFVDSNSRDAAGLAKTVMLVGTAKS